MEVMLRSCKSRPAVLENLTARMGPSRSLFSRDDRPRNRYAGCRTERVLAGGDGKRECSSRVWIVDSRHDFDERVDGVQLFVQNA